MMFDSEKIVVTLRRLHISRLLVQPQPRLPHQPIRKKNNHREFKVKLSQLPGTGKSRVKSCEQAFINSALRRAFLRPREVFRSAR